MSTIEILTNEDIEASLKNSNREYLVGELQLPQFLNYIHDSNVEAGITAYKIWTVEKPHYHKVTSEYIYMLEGECKYLDIKKNKEYHIKKGDFFVIHKDTIYAQKSKANTKLIFFKYPAGNDKVQVESPTGINDWYGAW
jgi:quercetin dioxygenase-like cupin family protein